MKPDTTRPTVLAVNDEPKVLELLTVLLEHEGYKVLTAGNGQRALELAQSVEPDIVVSDVVMPGMDGLEFCRRLKQDPRTAYVPVLLASAVRTGKRSSLNALTAGADDYLEMPFRRQELLVKVARLTERHRVERHYREIVEQAADIIYTRDMDGRLTSINESGALFFGRPAAELVGQPLSALLGEDAAAADITEAAEQVRDEPYRSVHLLKDAHGVPRYLEGVITLVRDAEGTPTGVRGVVRDITERVRAEQAMRESEERYRALVEQSLDGIFLIEPESRRIIEANPAYQRLLGYTGDELASLTLHDVAATDREIVDENIRQILSTEHSVLGERRHRRKDGSLVDVEVSVSLISYSGKKVLSAVVRDISTRRQAEEAVRRSEERYRELFENANDIIYTHDLQGNFTSLNRTGERVTGYTRDEAARMNMGQVVAPEHLERAREMISRKQTDDISTIYELDIVSKDGRRVPLEVSSRLIYEGERPVGVQGIARDVTERKRIAAELQASEAEMRALFAAMPDVILVLDSEGRYLKVAPTNPNLLYKPTNELVGKRLHEVFPRAQADLFLGHISRALETGQPVNIDYGLTIEGVEYWFEGTVSPMLEDLVVWVARDTTERKRTEQALEQQAEREAVINRISRAVRRSLDTTVVFHTAVQELGSYLGVDRCSLFMIEEQAGRVRMVAEYHAPGVRPAVRDFPIAKLKNLVDAVDRQGVMVFNDAAADAWIGPFYEEVLKPAGVKSIMYVAIKTGEEMPAAFAFSTTRGYRQWREADIALARAVADQTGLAIRQAELFQKAEATSAREALINRLSLAIRASLSLPDVLSTATRELGRALNASRVHLYMYDPQHPLVHAEHEYVAPNSASVRHLEMSFEEPIAQRLLRSPRPIVIADALNYAEGPAEFNEQVRLHAQQVRLRSQILCPLIVNGRFRSALCIHQTDRVRRWTEDEVALVEAVAAQIATGIAQAELFEMTGRAKKEWETTFNAMSDGIFIFDNNGQLIRVNRAGAAMEDTWPHLMLGRRCCDILRTSEGNTCIVEKTIHEARSVTIEIVPERFNRPLLVTCEPIIERGDRIIGAVCTARDLSELRKAEAKAREHQTLLTNILESARESIYAVDTAGRFQWCNRATLEATGYKSEQLIGHSFLDITFEADREPAREHFERTLDGKPQTYEARFFSRDGALRYALFDTAPLVVEGRTTGVLGIARDITEQKQERQRAAQADKLRALGQLASGVAHDFNNALTAILGRAQLMRRQVTDESLTHNLDVIQTAAEDAAATVRRIQTFARQSPSREFEALDVSLLLADAVEITRTRWHNEARLRGLLYAVELEAERPVHVSGVASELREVFVNLIVNAVDAMPDGGQLLIGCERDGREVRLRFSDSGTGMPEEVRERIFEPFYTTKGAHGTGLGLAVSYGIIERHEGRITVESEVGRGTTFQIELPAAELAAPGESSTPAPAAEAASLSVLVIDDEVFVRETLADMLAILGHRVRAVAGGREGLRELSEHHYDLVFTDLSMPEMDGWETAREIRRRGSDAAVILITGHGAATPVAPGDKDLVNGIIGKPFDFDQVAEAIAHATQKEVLRTEY
ncbi:MAG TPA: PAS domain S-box protein [Pyrinomonadaceae bacterium]|nr:PAS domain S-box protein [Pyrinomonadaceae bacterium]